MRASAMTALAAFGLVLLVLAARVLFVLEALGRAQRDSSGPAPGSACLGPARLPRA
jgi:hypothetical protein